jgi:hypothetical protein
LGNHLSGEWDVRRHDQVARSDVLGDGMIHDVEPGWHLEHLNMGRRDEHSFILAMRYEQSAQWQIERRVDWDDCGSGDGSVTIVCDTDPMVIGGCAPFALRGQRDATIF